MLLGWYWELRKATTNGFGLCAISHSEIQAWQALTHVRLRYSEVQALRSLDERFIQVMSSKDETDDEDKSDQDEDDDG